MVRTVSSVSLAFLWALSLWGQTPVLSDELPINTYTTGDQRNSSIAVDASGDFFVVWQSAGQDGDGLGVFGQRYDVFSNPAGPEFQVNTSTTGNQYAPRLSADSSGNFVVVWTSSVHAGEQGAGIFGQRYDSSGNPSGSEFHVNTYTTGAQHEASVAMDTSSAFVVVWTSAGQDGNGDGVFGQRYDAAGTPQGGEFQVNTHTTGSQNSPSVAIDASGAFVVAWSGGSASPGYDIFGRRYDSSGAPLGGEFQVNALTGMNARNPWVAMDDNGGFAVAWAQSDGAGTGIFGQRFDGTGSPQGAQFQVNTYTTGDQGRPSVAMDANQEFVVCWQGAGQDDGGGVFAQRFRSPNVPFGSEFQINIFTTGQQLEPQVAMNLNGNFVVAWASEQQDGSGYGVRARRGELHAPQGMAVDVHGTGTTSDLNGVLEPGETVSVEPAWQDTILVPVVFGGVATNLTGPAGGVYNILDGTADYGTINPGNTANCYDATPSHDCYLMQVTGSRPAAHWDATFSENIGTSGPFIKVWTLHIGDSFPDVPRSNLFYAFIENLFHNGVTGGCGGGSYCPGSSVTRAQMAVFLLKSEHGSQYVPPPCAGVFGDVPCPSPFADWIERLFAEGITGGCGGGNYCPDAAVTRQQMSAFLLKTKYGSTYVPNACAGIFGDVPCPSLFADWIEDLYNQQITGGCQSSPLLYCPTQPNTRGQMAVFLVKTFGLLLYGP